MPIILIGFIADTFYIDRFCSDRFHTDTFHTDMFCLSIVRPQLLPPSAEFALDHSCADNIMFQLSFVFFIKC